MKLRDIIDFQALSFATICERIQKGDHFSLARYGDGEFSAILGEDGANCDNHPYYPAMGRELADTLRSDPSYFIGLHESAKLQDKTLNWLEHNGLITPDDHGTTTTNRVFVPNAVFHDALVGKDNNGKRTVRRDGIIDGLWQAIHNSPSPVAIIAPPYVADQTKVKCAEFVPIPGRNTYFFLGEIKTQLDECDFTGWTVLVCASMTAPLIVDYLYRRFGDSGTFIDFGSIFDYYVQDAPFRRSFFQYAK